MWSQVYGVLGIRNARACQVLPRSLRRLPTRRFQRRLLPRQYHLRDRKLDATDMHACVWHLVHCAHSTTTTAVADAAFTNTDTDTGHLAAASATGYGASPRELRHRAG